MKKIIVLFLIVSVLFVSCSKEEDITNPNDNKQSIGASSNDLLSDKKFKSMVIEVVYVDGFEPSEIAIQNFVAFINARTYKPNGITVIKRAIASPGKETFSINDVVAIEENKRTKYNTFDTIAVWVLFLDGKASDDTATSVILGQSYRNTSLVIFEKTLYSQTNSTYKPNRSVLETTVITHEFGHILGLTNIKLPMQTDHEDTLHPKHCNVESCLMYWSSELGSGIGNMVSGGSAPQLDAKCIADLRANGGK